MTRHALLLPFAVMAFVSCTHTYEVGYDPSQTTPEAFSLSVMGEDVSVTLRDKTEIDGRLLLITPDTLRLRTAAGDSIIHYATKDVATIVRGGSAVGPVLGFLGGGGIGVLVGYAVGRGERGSGAGIAEFFGMVIIGSAGALAGTVIGANITPGREFLIPATGIPRKPSDTLDASSDVGPMVAVEIDKLLEETPRTVTFRWYERTTTLPKARITIERRGPLVLIRAPRGLLYNADNTPRYHTGKE
ncbi:MAG: hypothetical protein AB1428_09665 [Bacteroidota bacterium]